MAEMNKLPRNAEIGKPERIIEVEPMIAPSEEPIREDPRKPAREPEKVPA